MGFIDDEVDRLLVLEKEKEASIAMVSIEIESDPDFASEINSTKKEQNSYTYPLLKTISPSRKEIQFPLIWKTHESSKLFSKNETKDWINSGISQIHNFLNLEEDPPNHIEIEC